MSAIVSPTALDRMLAALRLLVRNFFPALTYWIVHEYAVEESDGTTFSGLPTDAGFSPALPTRVPYAPSLAGSSCVVPIGTLAYVGFANADPSKPFLVRFGAGASATQVGLAGGGPGLARVGDFVCRLYFEYAGASSKLWISFSASAPYAWTAVAGVAVTPPTPTDAGTPVTITTGSTIVGSG